MTNGNSERLGKASGLSRHLLALLVGLLATVALIASGAPSAAAQTRVGAQPQNLILTIGPHGAAAPNNTGLYTLQLRQLASATGVAAETGVDIGAGRFAQKSFSETFSKGGLFSGRTINSVAGDLRSGALSAKDVPIDVISRDGNTLILNTRSAQALTRAGIPRGTWNVIDRTGQSAYESRLSDQLSNNGLDSSGYGFPP